MKTEGFDKAPREKQMEVINAGFSCFARSGFQKTAMSEIAKEAGVSKASLFHYFGTKKALYDYLYEFASREIKKELPKGGEDFFACIEQATLTKVAVMKKYPGMYDFMMTIFSDPSEETEEVRKSYLAQEIYKNAQDYLASVDWSKLRDGVTPEDAMNVVTWISMGYLKENQEKPQEEVVAGVKRYLELMKLALYR